MEEEVRREMEGKREMEEIGRGRWREGWRREEEDEEDGVKEGGGRWKEGGKEKGGKGVNIGELFLLFSGFSLFFGVFYCCVVLGGVLDIFFV